MNEFYIELERAKNFIIDNQLQKALEILQALLEKYPNQECIIFEIGKIYIIEKKYQLGIKYLEKIKISKEYGELVYELRKMKEIMNKTVYKGRWKLIRFLIK